MIKINSLSCLGVKKKKKKLMYTVAVNRSVEMYQKFQ